MNKEKEIAEMAKKIYECGIALSPIDFVYGAYGDDHFTNIAKYLATVGYGNVKQYQDEIDRLHTELAHREEDLVHADEKVFYREMAVKLDEDKIKKQAVKEFAKRIKMEFYYEFEELIPSIMANKIDDLITELYGADE